jgi:hypothetical protein
MVPSFNVPTGPVHKDLGNHLLQFCPKVVNHPDDIPRVTQGRSIMYADDTLILNVGQDTNELQNTTSNNVRVVEQYFEANILFISPSKAHYILFQTKQCRQESNLKILIKYREI